MKNPKTWCPECGLGVPIDEDGCCASCGATATGKGVDRALRVLARLILLETRSKKRRAKK